MPEERPRIRTFSQECRERFGEPVGKIPLDLGIPCPNRARGGCIFCHPASFTPASLRSSDHLQEQIRRGKTLLLKNRFRRYFAYFQQETCTALPTEELLPQLEELLLDPACVGLILSTRPDAIAPELPARLAALLRRLHKTCLIELGLQSAHEKSLHYLNRNHSYADFLQAVERISPYTELEIGVHLLLGIPGESTADMLTTVERISPLPIHALKLHHLQVIRGTPLHTFYEKGKVPVFSAHAYEELLLRLLPRIPDHLTIHRLWATSHPNLLIAPRWDALASELSQHLLQSMAQRGIRQGQDARSPSSFQCPPDSADSP